MTYYVCKSGRKLIWITSSIFLLVTMILNFHSQRISISFHEKKFISNIKMIHFSPSVKLVSQFFPFWKLYSLHSDWRLQLLYAQSPNLSVQKMKEELPNCWGHWKIVNSFFLDLIILLFLGKNCGVWDCFSDIFIAISMNLIGRPKIWSRDFKQ